MFRTEANFKGAVIICIALFRLEDYLLDDLIVRKIDRMACQVSQWKQSLTKDIHDAQDRVYYTEAPKRGGKHPAFSIV